MEEKNFTHQIVISFDNEIYKDLIWVAEINNMSVSGYIIDIIEKRVFWEIDNERCIKEMEDYYSSEKGLFKVLN